MPRNDKNDETPIASEVEAVVDVATEVPADEATEGKHEAPEATDTPTEAPAAAETADGPSKADQKAAEESAREANLATLFQSIDTVIGDAETKTVGRIDASTGAVTDEDLAALVGFYTENFPKAADIKAVDAELDKLITKLMIEKYWPQGARAAVLLKDAFGKVGRGARTSAVARPVIDPTEALVAKVVSLSLSANFVTPGDGVAEDWTTKARERAASLGDDVVTYKAYLAEADAYNALSDEDKATATEPTVPEVDPIVIEAARIARGRAAGKRAVTGTAGPRAPRAPRAEGGSRGDVMAHIQEVFADKPVGTVLKVSEVSKEKTSAYPDGNCSGGAISARIEKANFSEKAPGLEFNGDNGKAIKKVA